MKKRYIQILFFLSFVILISPTRVAAQEEKKDLNLTIKSVVKDENGEPVKDAIIYGNEGAVVAKTDTSGRFTIIVPVQTDILIESDGYEPTLFKKGEYENLKELSLKASLFLYSDKDIVNVAFRKVKRGDLVNAISTIEPGEILQYDNVQSISDALYGRIPGLLGSDNIRGIGDALFVVDGFPRDISTINLEEVEQITVLKDINSSMMYGSSAINGVVLITTKRGKAYKKQLNVSGYYGVSAPIELPKYLSSADYMELYNEARVNDGLPAQYDADMISNYRNGNPYRYPNVDYYSNKYLKAFMPFSRIMTEVSGGNDIASYYSNIGWEQAGSLINFGEGENAKQNKFNVRGNVDLKVNKWIKSSLDAVAIFNSAKGPVGEYWSVASILHPNLYTPLIPINMIASDNQLLLSRKNDINGEYLIGGRNNYLTNPIANGYSGGVNENIQRTFSFNNRIDFDLNRLVKGLAFHTNVSTDFFTRFDQAIHNSYAVYEPTWDAATGIIDSLVKYGNDSRNGVQEVGNSYYFRRFGFYGLLDYDRTYNGVHHISASLLGNGNSGKGMNDIQGNKNANLGMSLNYGYKNKYLVNFSSAYVNSVKLPENNRRALSPSLGFAWVLSSEDFMSKISAIDYLKLRFSGGIMNTDHGISNFYLYDDIYARSGAYSWYDGSYSNSGTIAMVGSNNKLFFEKHKEMNLGLEGVLFNHLLSFDANIFTTIYSDIITRPLTIFPSFYADYIPYTNFNKNGYRGAELGLSINRSFGDLSFMLGANALYSVSEVLKKDEVNAYKYQNRTGLPVDAIFGLVSDRFFMDQNDIDTHETQAFGNVVPGDIKYIDQNNDKIINADDEVQIGRWSPPFSYGLNLKISYNSFTFFALGNGSIGGDSFISGNYYQVDGDEKYSEYILNRWTEKTKTTATFPRLSSLSNSNNYQTSDFWLYRNNYFALDRVQLTYDMPVAIAKLLRMKKLSFFLNSSSLLLISKHKEISQLNVGSEPKYRSFSIGVKTMF